MAAVLMPSYWGILLFVSNMSSDTVDPAVLKALEFLCIPQDGTLMVHSSFKLLSLEGHSPKLVLGALVQYMETGTLLLPTMSWRFVNRQNPVFDELLTPSNTGILTEMFRTDYASTRSLHPTHSVAGRGYLSQKLLESHHLDDTPCSVRSPFGLLPSHGGWVLMMGISMDCCTLVHHVEEMVAGNIYLKPSTEKETFMCRDRWGKEVQVHLRRHLFLPRDYWQFQDKLATEGLLRVTKIDNTVCRAFRAADIVEVVTEALKVRPDAVIAKNGQRYRMM